MIVLKDWETEKAREFSTVESARIWSMGKLVQRYLNRIVAEDLSKLISRLGLAVEVVEDTNHDIKTEEVDVGDSVQGL